jgi:hypothetical protein
MKETIRRISLIKVILSLLMRMETIYNEVNFFMSNHTGNISTIVKMILLTVLPYIIADSQTQDQVISIILAIVGLIIAYVDAKYPNTLAFLDNAPSLEEPAQVGEIRQPIILNEEYVTPIIEEDDDGGC